MASLRMIAVFLALLGSFVSFVSSNAVDQTTTTTKDTTCAACFETCAGVSCCDPFICIDVKALNLGIDLDVSVCLTTEQVEKGMKGDKEFKATLVGVLENLLGVVINLLDNLLGEKGILGK
ncbi:uncharacterized protein LOC124354331 [Homalodisca vitripennis]|uniref:uncharacterized protein LOC124354331 n=1 Tax=Homalodisca vitripennis TaxID=197043 RepID=UPI001EEA2DAB|nr:uncharacterized protein LOC124354331 [Homalodisca vitripennis]KAG8286555.1 hypothetical protein J6590_056876 [Homalodisca vitripennis]